MEKISFLDRDCLYTLYWYGHKNVPVSSKSFIPMHLLTKECLLPMSKSGNLDAVVDKIYTNFPRHEDIEKASRVTFDKVGLEGLPSCIRISPRSMISSFELGTFKNTPMMGKYLFLSYEKSDYVLFFRFSFPSQDKNIYSTWPDYFLQTDREKWPVFDPEMDSVIVIRKEFIIL